MSHISSLDILRSGHFNAEQLARRTFCVNALKDFQQAGVKAWDALAEIKEKKLYWPHDSVKSFCAIECGWTDKRFYQLVNASKVRASLPTKSLQLLTTESQARELGKVPEEKRVTVLKEAKSHGEITAKSIKAASKSVQGSNGDSVEVDIGGKVIPANALPCWSRKSEAKEIIAKIAAAKKAVNAIDRDDKMYCEVNLNGVLSSLNDAEGRFKSAIPAHVCPYCKGVKPDGCKACKGRGVVSKYFWDTAVPKEMKPEIPF